MIRSEDAARSFKSVLIIDDHPLFCDALMMTLRAVSDINHFSTAFSLQDALDSIERQVSPNLICLDLNLPDVDGIEGLIRLRGQTKVPILVVSSMVGNRMISAAIKAGATGFVPKHSDKDVFRQAIACLKIGRTFVPEGYVLLDDAQMNAASQNDVVSRLSSLTNQQSRILQLICDGKLNKQIAYDLSIAETTVKAHVTAIMRKLGVQSRTQAVLLAKDASFSKILLDV